MKDAEKKRRENNKEGFPPNPFTEGLPSRRSAEEVWKELYANSKPISREEILRRIKNRPNRDQ